MDFQGNKIIYKGSQKSNDMRMDEAAKGREKKWTNRLNPNKIEMKI